MNKRPKHGMLGMQLRCSLLLFKVEPKISRQNRSYLDLDFIPLTPEGINGLLDGEESF